MRNHSQCALGSEAAAVTHNRQLTKLVGALGLGYAHAVRYTRSYVAGGHTQIQKQQVSACARPEVKRTQR